MKKEISQKNLVMEFFRKNPNRNVEHPEVVDWLTSEYLKRTGKVFRDPDRMIRQLHQERILVKVSKGVYKYDSDLTSNRKLEDFTEAQKEKILKRDGFKCVVCGKGKQDGVELQVDHIKPKDRGGKAEISNGQTLCASHNFKKKYYKQTETGKKMFIRLYELAKEKNDTETVIFCVQILEVFEKNNVNGHIEWKK